MSAAARAEARRKVILARGQDRLKQLTTSARGEDNPVYVHDETPARKAGGTALENFLGEDTEMPTPPAAAIPTPPTLNAGPTGPSAWSQEEQQEFLNALLSAQPGGPAAGNRALPTSDEKRDAPDPALASMMSAMSQFSGQPFPGGGPGVAARATVVRPKTTVQKLMPLIHLVASWCLLVFFVASHEPSDYSILDMVIGKSGVFERWAELRWRPSKAEFGVQAVPFFWAFMTLQLVLHSTQLFTGLNPVQLPSILQIALPHLPANISSLIVNAFSYMRMGSMLLNDIAGVVFGIGLFIFISGWLAG